MSDHITPEGGSDDQWMPLPNVNQLPPPMPGTGPTPPPFMSPPPVDLGPLTSTPPVPPGSAPPNRRPRWLLPVAAVLVLGGGATAIGISASRDSDDKTTAETDAPFKTVETDPVVFETDPVAFETDPTVFETDPTVFETDPTVFETDPPVEETDETVSETEPPFVDEPLPTFALNSGLVQPADLSYPVDVVSSDPATAPCSDHNALEFVPSTSDVAAAQTDTFFYLVQAGSFATADEADQFIDDLSSIKPCNFVHTNGVTESVIDVSFVGPVLVFTWQLETADGSQLFGVDGYFSDGKAVGVFSCSGDVEPRCTEMANAFITRLDSAVTEFG